MPKRVPIKYKGEPGKDAWTAAKLIKDQQGLWIADDYAEYEKQRDALKCDPMAYSDHYENERFNRYIELLYHFVPDDMLDEYSFGPSGRHSELMDTLADIENAYKVIERSIDFRINISKNIRKLTRKSKSPRKLDRLLTDEEFKHLQSLQSDVSEFETNFDTPRDDLFYLALEVDRCIQKGEEPPVEYLRKLKSYQARRRAGQPRKYAFKLLIINLAEVFERDNGFGHVSVIHESKDRRSPKACYSHFLDFMKDYLDLIGTERTFGTGYKTASYAKKILEGWSSNRAAFRGGLIRGNSAEDIAKMLEAIEKLKV